MLKVDYTLITKKGEKTRTDVPLEEMKEVDGNIMLVQGPSSKGKSTVMNMIAIGSFGESDESLSDSVRENLRELTTASYRDLSFDIELDNKYCNTGLSMSKSSGKRDIKVVEIIDGQRTILSADLFRRKYNLIYDVPENPTKRLEQIRNTIKDDHREAKEAIRVFMDYLRKIKSSVDKVPSRDTVEQYKNNLASESKLLERYEMDFQTLEMKKMRVNTAVSCRKYLTIEDKLKDLDNKITIEKKKPVSNKSEEQLRVDAMNSYLGLSKEIMIKPSTKEDIKKTKNSELIGLLEDAIAFDFTANYNNLRSYIDVISQMRKLVPEDTEDQGKVRLINELLNALERVDGRMSLGSVGTVQDLFQKLLEFRESSGVGSSMEYTAIRKDLDKIKINYERVRTAAEAIDKAVDKAPVATRNIAQIEAWDREKNALERERRSCVDELRKDGVIISNVTGELHKCCGEIGVSIRSKSEELEGLRQEINSKYNGLNGDIEKSKKLIKKYKETIDSFDSNKLPKYYADSKYLAQIIDKSNDIRTSITEAEQRLQRVINHDDSEYRKNPVIYDNIWKYIGSKLGVVRDCGEEHRVERVDLLIEEKGTIYVEGGVEIHIGAMGTGEGQLSYLRGLLSTGDDRKIIALFDEVGNMSNNLLTSLTEDFIKLEKAGKLMIAFMARPTSDEFEVKVYD